VPKILIESELFEKMVRRGWAYEVYSASTGYYAVDQHELESWMSQHGWRNPPDYHYTDDRKLMINFVLEGGAAAAPEEPYVDSDDDEDEDDDLLDNSVFISELRDLISRSETLSDEYALMAIRAVAEHTD
jgi:hypothetical protein